MADPPKPRLLAGGNPQIPKGYGEAPVQAWLDAVPGWQQAMARRVDAIIERSVPGVCKAVKYNSPMYGMQRDAWFLSMHCFTRYLKLAFFHGAALRPVPPGTSRQPHVRYVDLHEHDAFDEAQLAAWVEQASRLPGERL